MDEQEDYSRAAGRSLEDTEPVSLDAVEPFHLAFIILILFPVTVILALFLLLR